MRAFEFLNESTGLSNRKSGDTFKNPQGDELTFADVSFYPTDSPAYPSAEDRDAAIAEVAKSLGTTADSIHWSNSSGAGMLAFGVAQFSTGDEKKYYLGRYYKKVSPNKLENYFPNDLPGGFKLQTKTAQKEAAGYKPTDVLKNLRDLTPDSIVAQIKEHFGTDSDEARAVDIFVKSAAMPITIPKGQMNPTAFTNYFAEMLQPMALVLGKPVAGNATEAESKFFGKQGFNTCTISFGAGKTAGLSDSTLKNSQGKEIILSSKAESGAKASAKNLQEKFAESPEMAQKYPEIVDILNNIVEGGFASGMLRVAEKYKLIDAKEIEQVMSLRGLPGSAPIVGSGKISKNLEKLYAARKADDSSKLIPFYHMLAAVAYPLADYVNKNTNFSQAASDILNHGALIQMYTKADIKGDNIVIKEFIAQYPSKAVTSVLLSAHKTYYSTGNKGNLTFLIKKN
jgi:hypothetical protein